LTEAAEECEELLDNCPQVFQ